FYLGNYGLHVWLIQAKDRCAVKRHAVNELREGALNVFERGVLIDRLAVNGGHHRDDSRKEQEIAIAFARLDVKERAFAKPRGRACLIHTPAHNERWIQMCSS